MAGTLLIHGISGYTLGATVKIFFNGTLLGSVKPGCSQAFSISQSGSLIAKCGINPQKGELWIEDGRYTEVRCTYNAGSIGLVKISSRALSDDDKKESQAEKLMNEDKKHTQTQTVRCKQCGAELKVPRNMGNLRVTCPKCKYVFMFNSGPKPVATPTPTPKPTPAPSAKPASRVIIVRRFLHAHKGLKNTIKDNLPVHIFLDEQDQGTLSKDGSLTLHINSDAHTLKCVLLGKKYVIPAGNEDYIAFYFNDSLQIGPSEDPFRDALTAFVIRMFCGQGIKDRMADLNNRHHTTNISISSSGIRLFWPLNQTHGFNQWATGGAEEKITFAQAGLTPLPQAKQPGGYWAYVQSWVESELEASKEADVERYMGGFRRRTMHALY